MAELALGVVGVALAWKGLVDFCDLLSDLIRSDDDQRQGLALRAKCIKKSFKDWGVKYRVEEDDGLFASFDGERKEIIAEVLQRQLKASTKLFQVLQKYDSGVQDPSSNAKSFRKAVAGYREGLRKSTHKMKWKLSEEKMVIETVNDLELQARNLWDLTCNIGSHVYHEKQGDTDQILASIRAEIESLRSMLNTSRGREQLTHNVTTTNVAINVALRPIAPIAMLEKVEAFAQRVLWEQVDSRIGEGLVPWWMYSKSSIMCIETPVEPGDETGALTCTAFYMSVQQPKLIYILDPLEPNDEQNAIAGMYESLIQQAVQYLVSAGEMIELPSSWHHVQLGEFEKMNYQSAFEVFWALVPLIAAAKEKVLIVIEGLETLALVGNDALEMCISFIKSLRAANTPDSRHGQVRALFTGQGRGNLFDLQEDDVHVLDIMGTPSPTSNLLEQLDMIQHA